MTGPKRLIEVGFPLEGVSLDSAHEKNVRHGHLSTLHIWPARRPLAACRAALVAALLPDPGNRRERREMYERLAGRVVDEVRERREGGGAVSTPRRVTRGGILHWGREGEPGLDWFRERIREAYGGRAPRVLDPFAGGGAIPLEAMRLGCEATAADLNPVAWFLLRCALEYPQRLAGETAPLPEFAKADREFLRAYWKSEGLGGAALEARLAGTPAGTPAGTGERPAGEAARSMFGAAEVPEVNLAWQVRAWSRRVLARARRRLARRYPTWAEFRPLRRGGPAYAEREPRLLTPDEEGRVSVEALNAEFDETYLAVAENPRWVARPTVAYLWARTVACKRCRATVPLLKTRWLCNRPGKRVLLTMEPNAERTGVEFGVERETGSGSGRNRAQVARRGAGTTSRTGARCPCCSAIMAMEDLRIEGRAGRMGSVMMAVVVDAPGGKGYRLPRKEEIDSILVGEAELEGLYREVPFGIPEEPTPSKESLGVNIPLYGFDRWRTVFTDRQLLAMGVLVCEVRSSRVDMEDYPREWREAIAAYLACTVSKVSDYSSALCSWDNGRETMRQTFGRFAFPMVWDFCEVNPLAHRSGGFSGMAEWVCRYLEHAGRGEFGGPAPRVEARSALQNRSEQFDLICTDPPYYDAIPYSDLMDFFHIWLRRVVRGLSGEIDEVFAAPLGPKWNDAGQGDGELIDEAARFGGDHEASKKNYEEGMERAFSRFKDALKEDGRLVVVFANKRPQAWETLVGALIRSGFVVTGSWPIRTEMQTRQRSIGSAALAASVWLVCRKRPAGAAPGWDQRVLAEMRKNIQTRLGEFWDAGLRGPDFVWAATGPALEAFSRHPVVRKERGGAGMLGVREFLAEVRKMVVDFVVKRVLTKDGGEDAASGLDPTTAYYLLHRYDYAHDPIPVGASILYAQSCGLSDADLTGRFDLLERSRGAGAGGAAESREDEEGEAPAREPAAGGGGTVRLKPWHRRRGKTLGDEGPGGRPAPLVDQAHRLLHLWKSGRMREVDDYLHQRGLLRQALFARLLQALIELAPPESEERGLLESVSNHLSERAGATRSAGLHS